jgi:hypothetical protein
MNELRNWIRWAEAIRGTCGNPSELDALIQVQKRRLAEMERAAMTATTEYYKAITDDTSS